PTCRSPARPRSGPAEIGRTRSRRRSATRTGSGAAHRPILGSSGFEEVCTSTSSAFGADCRAAGDDVAGLPTAPSAVGDDPVAVSQTSHSPSSSGHTAGDHEQGGEDHDGSKLLDHLDNWLIWASLL